MPVRSLNSSVLKWPRREEVEEALLSWVEKEKRKNPDILRIGVFGSIIHPFWERGRPGCGGGFTKISLSLLGAVAIF